MDNKDLLWQDFEIQWPKHDYVYFDYKMQTNNLLELAQILHADNIQIVNIINIEDYGIYYHPNKTSLECWNCDIELDYNSDFKKIKIGGKTYA